MHAVGVSAHALQQAVSKGSVSLNDLSFYDGECLWEALQLENEIQSGRWICVRAPTKMDPPLLLTR